ncbi:SH3 domain-binding protein 5 homolog [Anopheles ziemanni]|uniref:SH3 domain-binding protein 5 homolog n=1 Tax=Anopheles coustani TaxID=139045 RepID=UPI00265B1D1B|nr:SH3 domain-binding protein 5 homolog [Anopheles coustani]XP_058115767.1 SH3 domain-binding protein 5 homolog [Anopheles coustani]XP_058174987.1 SH3 domain-binding protein 5 homolog [Anopheles ziemanni]
MASSKKNMEESEETELDPRIQIELENLNTATDDINKLEIELEEANSTFRILMNESTRRLKLSSKKLGSCIEKARPYYEALEKAKVAQLECQAATLKYQRANEIHAAAKETVALAEQRFMSNSHEWQFDNAWQEMLNHATIKVTDAEKQKAESGAEHQKKAKVFEEAEKKVQQLEERYRRSIQKSRPYFDEKQLCQEQLEAQKGRIQQLEQLIQASKSAYSTALRNLEKISEEIHQQRGDLSQAAPSGPREPGVGAELANILPTATPATSNSPFPYSSTMPDISSELDKCEIHSVGSASLATSSAVSEKDPTEEDDYSTVTLHHDDDDVDDDLHLELLRQKVRTLAVRPVEGGDGQQQEQDVWEHELNATVDKLDHLMMLRECSRSNSGTVPASSSSPSVDPAQYSSLPATPKHQQQHLGRGASLSPVSPMHHDQHSIKMFKKLDPLPLANVSMYALPTYLSSGSAGDTSCGTLLTPISATSPLGDTMNHSAMQSSRPETHHSDLKLKRKMSM